MRQADRTLRAHSRKLPGADKAVTAVIALAAEEYYRPIRLAPLFYGRPGKLGPGLLHHLAKAYAGALSLRFQFLHLRL